GNGVRITNASSNMVGGFLAAAGNVISANRGNGVDIQGAIATGNVVQGNEIGTDAKGAVTTTGTDHKRLGNSLDGVRVEWGAFSNTIGVGGTGSGLGNVISGNGL